MKIPSLIPNAVVVLFCAAIGNRVAAAEFVLQTPTGATVACSELGRVRDTDMQRLFGVENFHAAHTTFVRFRTYAPRDCHAGVDTSLASEIGLSAAKVALLARTAAAPK